MKLKKVEGYEPEYPGKSEKKSEKKGFFRSIFRFAKPRTVGKFDADVEPRLEGEPPVDTDEGEHAEPEIMGDVCADPGCVSGGKKDPAGKEPPDGIHHPAVMGKICMPPEEREEKE